MATLISSFLTQVVILKVVGKISDKYGNIVLTKIATGFVALTPFTWAISYFIPYAIVQKLSLVFIAQVLNEIGWGGFNISMTNYVYDSTKEERQGFALAYMNLFNDVGYFMGALVGSLLVKIEYFTVDIIVIIFLISFILRTLTTLIGSRYIKELKHVKKFDAEKIIHHYHPFRNAIHSLNIYHRIKHPHHRKEIHHI